MNKYESVIIIKPNIDGRKISGLKRKIKNIITKQQGNLLEFIDLGTKLLAFEIKGNKTGYYLGVDFEGTSEAVVDLERIYRQNENVLKYITVNQDCYER